MMRLISSMAVGAAVLALSLPASAGKAEDVKGKAVFAFQNPVAAANKLVKKVKLPGVPSKGLYGRDHCSPYDETMVPVNGGNGDGENGYYCVSKKPASVTCEVVGEKCEIEGDSGLVCRAVLGKCNPPGGWAGSDPRPEEPQAP